jgi:hypothetical protein
MICFSPNGNEYVIGCGSVDSRNESIHHTICNECECILRLQSDAKRKRMIKCPKCRTVETSQGIRSIESHKLERKAICDYLTNSGIYVPRYLRNSF